MNNFWIKIRCDFCGEKITNDKPFSSFSNVGSKHCIKMCWGCSQNAGKNKDAMLIDKWTESYGQG
jgi:hypothetical protein